MDHPATIILAELPCHSMHHCLDACRSLHFWTSATSWTRRSRSSTLKLDRESDATRNGSGDTTSVQDAGIQARRPSTPSSNTRSLDSTLR